MPPRKRLKANASPTRTRRGGRRKKDADDELPQVYQEMLAEAAISSQAEQEARGRASKRRRLSVDPLDRDPAESPPGAEALVDAPVSSPAPSQSSQRKQQVIYEDFGSDEDDSDVDFEDVEIQNDNLAESAAHPEQRSLQLDLSAKNPQRPSIQRRKPVGKAERDRRLNVHKAHLLLLLLNIRLRRKWCESEEVQAILKPLISRKLRNMLHVGGDKPDYQRAHSYSTAIEEICNLWRNEFEVTRPGMRSAYWKDDVDAQRLADDFDDPSSYDEFLEAAGTRHGSRDLGGMLFCALLRSAAVETRLVCSLQVLPFSAVAKGQPTEKPGPEYAHRAAWPRQELPKASHDEPSNVLWRQSEYAGAAAPTQQGRQTKKKVHDSPYPIFWVEVLLPTTQAWIPLDPLVRKTINKPKTGFEPPLSDSLNSMSYVIAFEESGFARDVTRRYAQFFNAKTRKQRIESTKHGEYWWSVIMQWFRHSKPMRSLSDVIEDKELNRKSENEPMPKNISDFKDHPVFALERHLRRNEIVWPNKHRGHVSAGNKDGKQEKVYDRTNVHVVRSADQWYRRGRDLKFGEQPLKRVAAKRQRDISIDEDEDEEGQDGTALYAEFQTELYVPPPVVRGRIPKNQYGNLDVYVPTMIPPGAIHLQHPEARSASRLLGIDYTDAVTGFKFKGRQGTAIIDGIVAAAEYREALVEVVEALEHEKVRDQEEKQSMISLAMWRKFMSALRIRARIDEDHNELNDQVDDTERVVASPVDDEDDDSTYEDDAAGGFMPDADEQYEINDGIADADLAKLTLDPGQAVYHPVVVIQSPHRLEEDPGVAKGQNGLRRPPALQIQESLFDDDHSGELFDGDADNDEPGGFVRETSNEVAGGGFMVEDEASAEDGDDLFADDGDIVEEAGFAAEVNAAVLEKQGIEHATDFGNAFEMAPSRHDEETKPLRVEHAVSNIHDPKAYAKTVDDQTEEDDDAGSLLSHDPDDDDAEEAWAIDIDD